MVLEAWSWKSFGGSSLVVIGLVKCEDLGTETTFLDFSEILDWLFGETLK